MADTGPARPAKSDSGAETSANGDFAELREMLVGPERAQLNELRERLANRDRRAGDLSEVLPDAIVLRARRDPALRQALQPLIEDALASSVRRDPRIIATALFPAIGNAIRRAVGAALQEMLESLNQIIETGLTLRSIGWRIEALRTGKSYGEIALLRSLLYRVEQVYLIQNETGLLLQHVMCDAAVVKDPDMISGMLTAIQNFVQDSFGAAENTLETVRVGEFSVWIQHGPQALLAAVIRGTPPVRIRGAFSSALDTIHREWGAGLTSNSSDEAFLEGTRRVLETCLLGQSPPGRRASRWPLYLAGCLMALALGIWAGITIRASLQWQAYLAALAEEPGIVVTHQERRGRQFSISGLRDPLARDPEQLLSPAGIPAEKVSSHWEPYLSLSPRLMAMRELAELRGRLERQMIRFNVGESALSPAAMDSVREAAEVAAGLLRAAALAGEELRIELTGHTDELGTAETNLRLGLDRANAVSAALIALGVDKDDITARSVGPAAPLPPVNGRSRQDENRRVSFRVLPAGRGAP